MFRKKIENLKILITGGGGFIGSHLYKSLIENQNKIIIVDSFIDQERKKLPKAKLYTFDIASPRIKRIFEREKIELVFHLAGPINLRKKITDKLFNAGLKTIDGFKKILDYSCDYQIKKIIFASSGAIYDGAKIIPTPENYPVHPSSLYGLANLFFEKLLEEYYKTHKLNFSILRLSNVYGPKQWETGVIASFIVSILNNKPPIITGDGRQTRDFIYIDDVVTAFHLAATNKQNEIFNVGSGKEISINQLVKNITKILNTKTKPRYIPLKDSKETKRNALDVSKIKKELTWAPKHSLGKGLEATIKWFKSKK